MSDDQKNDDINLFHRIYPAGKNYARVLKDRLLGDTTGFRTVQMQTTEGVVTLQTKGGGRPEVTVSDPEVIERLPALVEIDLDGKKTQDDRLYYHDDPEDAGAPRDDRIAWSSDGLLGLRVKPLRRIIFKTENTPRRWNASLWLGDESFDGSVSEPDVDAADTNTALVEVIASRDYHPEIFIYRRDDVFSDYGTLMGLGFAGQRLNVLEFTGDGGHKVMLSGFDESHVAVVLAGGATCRDPIEKKFSKRKYRSSDESAPGSEKKKLKKFYVKPLPVVLAKNGGLLPFSEKAHELVAEEYSGDGNEKERRFCDLARINAFGQMWHGYCEIGDSVSIWTDHSKTTPVVTLDTDTSSSEVKGAGSKFRHLVYKAGDYEKEFFENAKLLKGACFINGGYSPATKIETLEKYECLIEDAAGRVWKIRFDFFAGKGSVTITLTGLFDDFLPEKIPVAAIAQTLGSFSIPASPSNKAGIALVPAHNAKSVAVLAVQEGTATPSSVPSGNSPITKHFVIAFSGTGSLDAETFGDGIVATISTDPFLVQMNVDQKIGKYSVVNGSNTSHVYPGPPLPSGNETTSGVGFYESGSVTLAVIDAEISYEDGVKKLIDVACIDGVLTPVYLVAHRKISGTLSGGEISWEQTQTQIFEGFSNEVSNGYTPSVHVAGSRSVSEATVTYTERLQVGIMVGEVLYGEETTQQGSAVYALGGWGADTVDETYVWQYTPFSIFFSVNIIDGTYSLNNIPGMIPILWDDLPSPLAVNLANQTGIQGGDDLRFGYAFGLEGHPLIHDGRKIAAIAVSGMKVIYNPLTGIGYEVYSNMNGFYF